MNIKRIITFIGSYIIQVGGLWGFLEAYTYFKDDALKIFLGPYWVIVFILPFFTSIFFSRENENDQEQITISTRGRYSPGRISGNYRVTAQQEELKPAEKLDSPNDKLGDSIPNKKTSLSIQTEGDYSPGEVEGDYTID